MRSQAASNSSPSELILTLASPISESPTVPPRCVSMMCRDNSGSGASVVAAMPRDDGGFVLFQFWHSVLVYFVSTVISMGYKNATKL